MKKLILSILTIACLAALLLPAGAAQQEGLPAKLEAAGFTVQEGTFYELDALKLASEGKLMSCFGNNAGSGYMVFDLPEAPDQTVPDPTFPPKHWQYKLRPDEALVLITPLPPECTYYSFINYIMFTQQLEGREYGNVLGSFALGDESTGLYHPIFGSIGNPVNMSNLRHNGSETVLVVSANQTVTAQVLAQLQAAGYPEHMVNVMPIPENTYRMGLQKGADTFCFLGRISQPKDTAAYERYMATLPQTSHVYRVTPKAAVASNPYANAAVTPRGTGTHEAQLADGAARHLDQIRTALLNQYGGDYTYEELGTEIAVPEGLTAYFNGTNAQGDNRDAAYLMTKDFTLRSDEDFVVVYGVNHTETGKALYSNTVLYGRPMLNGACSIYDGLYPGSAKAYLEPDCDTQQQYYVYKIARTQMDEYTAVLPYSTGNPQGKFYGLDNGNPMLLAFRAYLDQNGVGGSYYELIYDRAIVFHKK